MKKILAFVCVILFVGALSAFAQTTTAADTGNKEPVTFIDFGNLDGTDIDFSDTAGASVSASEKANLKVDLKIENWESELASSSQVADNQANTYVKAATTKDGKTVLGVRIHFPEASYNSYCIIKPPFDIPAYEDKPGDPAGTGNKFTGKGVLKNVGPIKFIQMDVNGRNFPHGIGIIFEDQSGMERIVFIDYMRYAGWKTLIWKNPNYVKDVKNRELQFNPLYPQNMPFIKLKGLIIYRDGANIGGDFVAYVRNIKVAYDLAMTSDQELDINDEGVWHIVRDREEKRKAAELKRLGNVQVLRYLEKKKMYKGPDPTAPTPSTGQ
ncbi:MAG: flagellar protein [Spirochaetales bacterium]|nr:flagellar protein [Spirochaetales bacterium]